MNPTATIQIRPATPDDGAGIVQVQTQTWLATYPNQEYGITEAGLRARLGSRSEEEKISSWQERIAHDPGARTWVAVDGEKVVGFCAASKGDQQNKIGGLYLLPAYHRQGIGSNMLQSALAWLGPHKDVWLSVVSYNTPAIATYAKHGFKEVGPYQDDAKQFPPESAMPEIEMIKKAEA
jgi:RimJ/RimL family protein N-acetyltransferase